MDPGRFRLKRGTLLPVFMNQAWTAIFTDDGVLRDDVDVDAVSCLNQLTSVFDKIEGGHTKESETQCLESFSRCERDLKDWVDANTVNSVLPGMVSDWISIDDINLPDCYIGKPRDERPMAATSRKRLLQEARRLISYILHDQCPREISPKHGSGVSACQTPIHKRYDKPRYVRAIDHIWSYSSYYYLGAAHLADEMSQDDEPWKFQGKSFLGEHADYTPCAKVLLVPKDCRGPRIISCEPRETMWIQQGLMDKLATCLERHHLTQWLVNFTDQTINQKLAFRGSITREFATLDLKEASDRVSMWLVDELFPSNWKQALRACRSEITELPDGSILSLAKHAPMGSATCFPVMALSIWALLTAYANRSLWNSPLNKRKFKEWDFPVYVYGDDIIVSSTFADECMELLPFFGLKANVEKSFAKGFFRESCGKEYYRGIDITPVRLRTLPLDDVPSRMKFIAFHNNVYRKYGLQPDWLTSLVHEWYAKVPERSTRIHRPVAQHYDGPTSRLPILWGHHDTQKQDSMSCVLDVYRADNSRLQARWNKGRRREPNSPAYHRQEFRILAIVPRHIKYDADRWCQVFRALVNPRRENAFGTDALSKRVSYKYRWVPLY